MKNTITFDIHIRVDPRSLGDFGGLIVPDHYVSNDVDRDMRQRCNEIVEQIKRHIDNVRSVTCVEKTESRCSHCGADWNDNPTCCLPAVQEWMPVERQITDGWIDPPDAVSTVTDGISEMLQEDNG